MKLAEIQDAVKQALQANPVLAGVPIVLDTGLGEATRERASALKEKGLCLLLWRPEGGSVRARSNTGVVELEVLVLVFVEEVPAVNRAAGGTNLKAEDAAQAVLNSLSGCRIGAERLELLDDPLDNLGTVNGVNRLLVSAAGRLIVVPNT